MQWFFILISALLLSSCAGGKHHRASGDMHSKHHHAQKSSKSIYPQQGSYSNQLVWSWPAHGHIIGKFSETNRGLNFDGYVGDPIYAAASGKVIYSGLMRGYNNLIIIKHNSNFLTTYAYADKVFVTSGDWVRSGQKIAEIGETSSHKAMLHFEIRENGEPINPLAYLSYSSH